MVTPRIFGEARYKAWRLAVYQRDKFACRRCGRYGRGARLQAHHIHRWATHPQLRFELSNGITLCKFCHDMCKDNEDLWAAMYINLLNKPLPTRRKV